MSAMTPGMRARPEAWKRWTKVMANWKASGQGPAEFCRRNGITHSLFYKWRHRLQGRQKHVSAPAAALPQLVAIGTIPDPVVGSCTPGHGETAIVIRVGRVGRIEIAGNQVSGLLRQAIETLVRLS